MDLGGTKTEVIALSPDGEVELRERRPTPGAYAGAVDVVVALVAHAEAALGRPATVGVGIPGVVDPRTGRVKNANSTWLNGRPLEEDLSVRLARTVPTANDANCFVLSEATDGAGREAAGRSDATVFGVILGTGVGGGLVVDGRLHVGGDHIAGEWGHNPLPWPGADEWPGVGCWCGRRGCVETWVSGPALARDHRMITGRDEAPPAIAAAAAGGDAAAAASLARWVDRVGRSLATVCNVLDPDVVVLGGGLSNLSEVAPRVRAALAPHVFTEELRTQIVVNRHGDSSGVRGAAWLGAAAGTPGEIPRPLGG